MNHDSCREERGKRMLLNGINHIALISKDIDRLRTFYTKVFDAEVGPTKPHGDKGDETMTRISIGPHTELNVFTIEGNREPDRQTPMWGRGRLDHFGLQAASAESFETIRQRLMEHAASQFSARGEHSFSRLSHESGES